MISLTCKCCGFTERFESYLAAYEAGWDERTHLPSWPISCNLCPGVAALGMVDHSLAHEKWAIEGRPAEFSDYGLPPGPTDAQNQELMKILAKANLRKPT